MKGKDEGQIRKLLATPPRNLEDMIYSVLKRLSQDPELDQETTARILMWISFSRRPLKFGELDVIARLDSGTTNWVGDAMGYRASSANLVNLDAMD